MELKQKKYKKNQKRVLLQNILVIAGFIVIAGWKYSTPTCINVFLENGGAE